MITGLIGIPDTTAEIPSVVAPLRITVHTKLEDVEAKWRHFEASAERYAYQSYDWIANWYFCCGAQERVIPRIVTIEDAHGKMVMLLPLGVASRFGGRAVIWLGGVFADYLGPLLAPGCSAWLTRSRFLSLWSDIEKSLAPFDLLCLDRQPERINETRNPFIDLPCIQNPSSAHASRLTTSYDALVRSKRGSDWIRAERRKERRLAESGKLEFVVAESGNYSDLLDALIQLKSLRYREMGVKDLLATRAQRDFLHRLSATCIGQGFVRLFALKLDDKVLAAHWGLVLRDRFYHMLPASSRLDYRRYSPGGLLLRHMLEWAIGQQLRIFDFTIGDEAYKLEWRDHEMALFDCLVGHTLRGRFAVRLERAVRTLKRETKRNRILFGFGKRLRASIARWRHLATDTHRE
jgi:CelD/BcsL family acetyltransferase involved in cellulose biosynthesis